MARALVNKLKENKVYFPNYIRETYSSFEGKNNNTDMYKVTYGTLVRIQGREGKWYIAPFIKEFVIGENKDFFGSFLHDAYRVLVNGNVPIEVDSIKDFDNYSLFEWDELQISEQKRMAKMI